ncbi:MAG: T9SS type B sorting domain-containing protein [Flavobacterium sp.]|nr:T9SS type B sorting domain-containing protein [Flavobacterium sp.]
MTSVKTILFYIFICCISANATAQYITVNDSYTADQLVADVLVNSSCATTSNALASGDNFSGTQKSYAYFNLGTRNFPFKEGVVLSTWSSQNSIGPFVKNRGGGNEMWSGDSDLEHVLNLTQTKNATVLEFDFIPLTNFISFNYIFASNEYQDYYPCNFSDGFAFLIKEKGSAGPYQNLAVLPNSPTPVSSKNVRPFIPPFNNNSTGFSSPGCPPKNENYFAGYNDSSSPINYSAQTVVLNAQSAVIAGKTYHIKLVIADDQNVDFDSAVFLEAGSFLPKIDLGPDQTICYGDKTVLDTGFTDSTYTYEWLKDGIVDPLQTTNKYQVTDPGTYSVNVTIYGSCIAVGKTTVNYTRPITKTLTQCGDNTANATFDLTQLSSSINKGTTDTVDYYETVIAEQNQTPKITNPSAYTSTSKIIYARVTNLSGCVNYAEITLTVLSTSIPVQTLSFCDNDGVQDEIFSFDLKKDINPKILPEVVAPFFVTGYYLSAHDAAKNSNPIHNNYTNTINPQTIFARIENGFDCYGIYEIELNINIYSNAVPEIISNVVVNDFSGNNNTVTIETTTAGDYEYSLDGTIFQSNAIFTNVPAGTYTVCARDKMSCGASTLTIYVLDYPRFFTPNDDGFNDLWTIKNLNLFPKSTLYIFDRYGKLLKQLAVMSNGWNGTFNGYALPADDYWFHLNFENGKIIKGHFSLKR